MNQDQIRPDLQDQILKEESHWKEVPFCVADAVMFLEK